jgi:CheY-like chemotaxis protein
VSRQSDTSRCRPLSSVRLRASHGPDRIRGGDRKSFILKEDGPGIGLASLAGVCERLLVVDDDDDVRRAYESHFRGAGFEVECAATLQEAAERLSSHTFDAVIADISLTPDIGSEGLAIAAYLRNLRQDPPVVVLTAYGAPDRAKAAARLGVDAFLHKPVSLVWLESLLRARIDDRHRGPESGTETEALAAVG